MLYRIQSTVLAYQLIVVIIRIRRVYYSDVSLICTIVTDLGVSYFDV